MAEHPHGGHRARVKQRYAVGGLDAFSPHEIVEMLLFFGIPQRDTNLLAHRLIDQFGNVSNILSADKELLMNVEGMTPGAVTLLKFVNDLQSYCANEKHPFGVQLMKIDQWVSYLMPRFDKLGVEEVWIVTMDVLSRVHGVHCVSKGSPLSSDVNIRKIVQLALEDNATKIILAHNHPSGIAIPSEADVQSTMMLSNSLATVNIRLVDHLIYAGDECVSFLATDRIRASLIGRECSL